MSKKSNGNNPEGFNMQHSKGNLILYEKISKKFNITKKWWEITFLIASSNILIHCIFFPRIGPFLATLSSKTEILVALG